MAVGNKPALAGRQSGVAAGTVAKRTVARCTGVDSDGNPEFNVATDKGDATITTPHIAVGVFDRDAVSGGDVDILCGHGSILMVVAGAAVTEGRLLTFDTSGRAIDIVQVNSEYGVCIGVALAAAAAAGDEIPVLWQPGMISKPSA